MALLGSLCKVGARLNTTSPLLQSSSASQSLIQIRTVIHSRKNNATKWSRVLKKDGDFVYSHDLIVTQRELKVHPGMNVLAVGSFQLRAQKDGHVIFTTEKANMWLEHNWIKKFYPHITKGVPIYLKYAHVIPVEQHNRFKLIEQI